MTAIDEATRAALGVVDGTPDEAQVRCMACRIDFTIPRWIFDMVGAWNRAERDDARAKNRRPSFIERHEIAACPACLPEVRRQKDIEAVKAINLTAINLRELRAGRYDADSISWLRSHGHSKDVDEAFAKEASHAQF